VEGSHALNGVAEMTGCGYSPVTADVRKMGARLSEFMLRAHSSTSSMLRTRKGFFFTPGFLRMVMRFCSTGGDRASGARERASTASQEGWVVRVEGRI
jgi:hypothetical protein